MQWQAPYQHCDSSMSHNSQDQRFQKILSLWASLAFQAAQGTVLRVHPKPVNLHDFQWQPKLPHQAPLSFMSLYTTLAETVPRMFMDQTTKIIYLEGFLSAGSVQSCSWHGTGVPQGREKQARERSISLLGIKPRCNISFHSCYQYLLPASRLLLLNNHMMQQENTHHQQELPLLQCHHHWAEEYSRMSKQVKKCLQLMITSACPCDCSEVCNGG